MGAGTTWTQQVPTCFTMSSRIERRRSAGMCKASRYCIESDLSAVHTPLNWLREHFGVETRHMLERVCDVHMPATNVQDSTRHCGSPLQAAAANLQTAGRCEGVSKAYSDCNMSQPRRQRLYQRASISPRSHDVAGQSSPPSSRQIR